MRVVFDTNIFISAFVVPGGRADHAYTLARQGRFELYTSVAILTETAQKLRMKFSQSERDITQTLKVISRSARVVKPFIKLDVLGDAADNRILECATAAKADLVVTGDRHLLALKKFQGTAIIRLADFLRMFPD